MSYTAYVLDSFCIHGKAEGFESKYLALRWAKAECSRVRKQLHFADARGLRFQLVEKQPAEEVLRA